MFFISRKLNIFLSPLNLQTQCIYVIQYHKQSGDFRRRSLSLPSWTNKYNFVPCCYYICYPGSMQCFVKKNLDYAFLSQIYDCAIFFGQTYNILFVKIFKITHSEAHFVKNWRHEALRKVKVPCLVVLPTSLT